MNLVRTFAGTAVLAGLWLSATGCELLTAPDRSNVDGSGGTGATGGGGTGATGGGGSGAGSTGTTTAPTGGGGSGGTSSSSSGCVTPEDDMKECTDDVCQDDGSTAHTPKAAGTSCAQSGGAVCDAAGECVECNVAADCNDATRTCAAAKCVDVTCTDMELNGSETDVDCGGAGCSPCDDGLACLVGGDCESGVCDLVALTCAPAACGDGVTQAGETCDDDNTADCDGCRGDCQAVESGCGDGFLCGAEICDDGNAADDDGCSATCTTEPGFDCSGRPSVCAAICGDGIVETGEQCDDSNTADGDCCSSTCQIETGCEIEPNDACGASVTAMAAMAGSPLTTQVTGSLDPGASDVDLFSFTLPGTLRQTVKLETFFLPGVCGDVAANDTYLELRGSNCTGVLAGDEDDGSGYCSRIDGTTGDAGAKNLEPGTYFASVAQSTGAADADGYTLVVTVVATCGNGVLEPGEVCDDANGAAGDGCSATCTVEAGHACSGMPSVCTVTCGSGTLEPSETCDDGNTTAGDGCAANCTIEPGYGCTGTPSVCALKCGNGVLDAGETCDQGGGNVTPGDGCSATCIIEAGHVCSGTPSLCLLPEVNCNDGLDNNGGGGIDAADPTCALPAYFTVCGAGETLLVIPSTDTPKNIPNNSAVGTLSTVDVAATNAIVRAAVLVNVTHSYAADVDLSLTAPNAAVFDLSSDNGENGDHFADTVFDSTCATPIAGALFAAAPFSACYQPETSLAALASLSPAGAWTLKAADDSVAFSGKLNHWRLVLCTAP